MVTTAQPDPSFRVSVGRLLGANPRTLRFAPLGGGVSSDIWRVDRGDQTFCAKRARARLNVAAHWEVSTRRNAEEVRWLRTAREWIGEEAAEVVAADPTEGIAILTWYDPEHWRNWKTELLAHRIDPAVAGRLGMLLGRIAREAGRQPALAAEFANADLFDALRIDPFFRHLVDVHPALQRLIDQLEGDQSTLVHGDFSPKNVLVDENRRVRILDAECATWGSPGFDPGYLLAHLLLKRAHTDDPLLTDAALRFWTAFVDAVDGSLGDLDQSTYLPLAGTLLARVDGKSPVEYLTESERCWVREQSLTLLERPPVPISRLLESWPPAPRATAPGRGGV